MYASPLLRQQDLGWPEPADATASQERNAGLMKCATTAEMLRGLRRIGGIKRRSAWQARQAQAQPL